MTKKELPAPAQSSIKLVAKYDNRLNEINISELTGLEINIFFTALAKLAHHNTSDIRITYDEIARIAGLSKAGPAYVYRLLQSTKNKLCRLNLNVLSKALYDDTVWLFSRWRNDGENKVLTVSFSEQYLWLINDVRRTFTSFEIQELIRLKSKFSKMIFFHLKQWKTVGEYTVSFDDLKLILGIPASCPDKNILSKYIRPSVEEIATAHNGFTNLSVVPAYEGRNHKVTSISFRWVSSDGKDLLPAGKSEETQGTLTPSEEPAAMPCPPGADVFPRGAFREEDKPLRQLFADYLQMRVQIGSPLPEDSVVAAWEELDRLSGGDTAKKAQILSQSIANGWKGLYPLNEKKVEKREQGSLLDKWALA